MAINNVTTNTKPEKGITYSAITDSSVDWTGITNSTYFYDKATDLPYYKNSSGDVVSLFEEGGGGDSIYTADGTLTGNRILSLSSNDLTFNGTGLFKISNGSKSVYPNWNVHSAFNIDNGNGTVWTLYNANASSTFNANEFGIGVGSSIPFRIFNNTSVALGGVGKSSLDTNYSVQTNGNTLIGGSIDAKSGTNLLSFDFANYSKIKIGTSTSQWWFVNSNAGNSSTFDDNDLYLWDSTNSRKVVRFNANGSTELLNKVELSTTTDGFLMPRLTTAQKNGISSPDTNLMVFDTDLSSLQRYNGSTWVAVAAGTGIVQLNQEGSSGDSVFYTNVQSALTAANSSGGDITITLHDNITTTTSISTNATTNIDNITFDLNGFTITNTANDSSAVIYNKLQSNIITIINGSLIKTTGTGNALHFVSGIGDLYMSNCYVYSEAGSALKIDASITPINIWELGNSTFKTNTGYGVFLADALGGISLTNFISISIGSGMACFLNAGGDVTNFKAIAEGTGIALRVRSAVTSVTNFYAESNSGNCILLESLIPIVKDFTAISVSGYAIYSSASPYKIENFYCKTTSGTRTLNIPSTSILINGDVFSDTTDCAFISDAERVENVNFTTNSGTYNIQSRFTTNWINCTFRNKDGLAFYNYGTSNSKFKKCTFISEKTSGGTAHAANILDGTSVVTFVNCDFEVADSTVNCIKGNVAMNMKVANCSFDGSTTPISSNVTLSNTFTSDPYGNITI